jgi:small subunit ribosomal protein S11
MAEKVQTTTPVSEAEQTQAAADEAVVAKPTGKRKKSKRAVSHGQIHVLATFNNTIITITDSKGNTIATASAGAQGFRGSKKGTAYAAQVAAEKAIQNAKQNHGLSKADVFVKGIGQGRDAAVRTLINEKVQVDVIRDVTGVPHGGTRPRKQRRT